MQIERLIQLVFLLISHEHMTSKELANYFQVSRRTIYRDIDTLSIAGIPIYSSKGNGGGVGILKEFTIDKSVLSDKEKKEIVHGLQVLQAAKYPDISGLLNKMRGLFQHHKASDWIEVDFSFWGSEENERIKFSNIEEAILNKHVVTFEYFSSNLKTSERIVEPLRLIFKAQTWYIQGYCRDSQEIRVFRMSRIKKLIIADEFFEREMPKDLSIEPDYEKSYELELFKLKFSSEITHRIYDEYEDKYVEVMEDDSFLVTIYYPVNEWMVRHILSFGNYVEILEPESARKILKERAKKVYEIYK